MKTIGLFDRKSKSPNKELLIGKELFRVNHNITSLLQVFSRGSSFKDYCLAHLFTYHRFSRGVLGLAYIAGRENSQPGGICSTGPSPGKGTEINHQFFLFILVSKSDYLQQKIIILTFLCFQQGNCGKTMNELYLLKARKVFMV